MAQWLCQEFNCGSSLSLNGHCDIRAPMAHVACLPDLSDLDFLLLFSISVLSRFGSGVGASVTGEGWIASNPGVIFGIVVIGSMLVGGIVGAVGLEACSSCCICCCSIFCCC